MNLGPKIWDAFRAAQIRQTQVGRSFGSRCDWGWRLSQAESFGAGSRLPLPALGSVLGRGPGPILEAIAHTCGGPVHTGGVDHHNQAGVDVVAGTAALITPEGEAADENRLGPSVEYQCLTVPVLDVDPESSGLGASAARSESEGRDGAVSRGSGYGMAVDGPCCDNGVRKLGCLELVR